MPASGVSVQEKLDAIHDKIDVIGENVINALKEIQPVNEQRPNRKSASQTEDKAKPAKRKSKKSSKSKK